MRIVNKKFKEGAASFYIVAFATLVLMVIAASFAAIIISEVTRTSNDDLAQSAYDSALAGVEDAKLAFYNYQGCLEGGINSGECAKIMDMIKDPSCDMVGRILGRISDDEAEREVQVQESSGNNYMQQAYTCVKIETDLDDYKATLSGSNQTKVVRVTFDDDANGDGTVDENERSNSVASRVKKLQISWYLDSDNAKYKYNNFSLSGGVKFPAIFGNVAAGTSLAYAEPPTLSVAMVQTSAEFDIESFDRTVDGRTNRGMVYLVPTKDKMSVDYYNKEQSNSNYISAYSGDTALINKYGTANLVKNYLDGSYASNTRDNLYGGFLKSNDKTNENLPYTVYCNPSGDGDVNGYACSAVIELPEPVIFNGDGMRNSDTFVLAVSIPYGQPKTDFQLKFYCNDGEACSAKLEDAGGTEQPGTSETARLKVQVRIDSTGRANDLYRRVETRLDTADDFSLSTLGPLELLGSDDVLKKDYTVTCEYDFNATCSR